MVVASGGPRFKVDNKYDRKVLNVFRSLTNINIGKRELQEGLIASTASCIETPDMNDVEMMSALKHEQQL